MPTTTPCIRIRYYIIKLNELSGVSGTQTIGTQTIDPWKASLRNGNQPPFQKKANKYVAHTYWLLLLKIFFNPV